MQAGDRKQEVVAVDSAPRRMVVGISGVSGAVHGIETLRIFHGLEIESDLNMSHAAEITISRETVLKIRETGEETV